MSRILMGVFIAVFAGALVYEILNRTKPELMEKFEAKFSKELDSILISEGEKA